ncbi:MAG: integrin alpha [Planctomycetota bacterium]
MRGHSVARRHSTGRRHTRARPASTGAARERVWIARLTAFLIASAIGARAPAQAIYLAPQGSASSEFGSCLCVAWDVTGDGVPELLIGAPGADPNGLANAGSVFLISPRTGQLLGEIDGTLVGEALGTSIAMLGDVNGESIPDFVIGSPYANQGGFQAGRVTLFSGGTFTAIRTHDGNQLGEVLGCKVAGPGDLDGDSVPDYLVAASGYSSGGHSSRGAVVAFSGATGSELFRVEGDSDFDALGTALVAVPDLNGDGTDEFLAGAPGFDDGPSIGAGLVRMYSGANGSQMAERRGEQSGDNFGATIVLDADRTGDGKGEYLVGAPPADRNSLSNVGVVYLLTAYGLSILTAIEGSEANAYLGTSLCELGDIDGDGVADFALGEPDVSNGTGALQVYSGLLRTLAYRLEASASGDAFAFAVTDLGDVDRDGYVDYAIGAPFHGGGQVEIRRGLVPALTITGTGQIGTIMSIHITSEVNQDFLIIYDLNGGPVDSQFGTFLIGFTPYWGRSPKLYTDGFGHWQYDYSIPNDPALIGITFYMQALVFTFYPPNGSFLLSQGASITFS